ncbi:MAG: tRNA lysidine(34) synthetase TilS [Roseburia sp.]|nr:tRNA lysidine(34) synthetase TilS [Roseburia sp.]
MYRTILQYCKKEKLIENGDFVLAGVSGGADSVCMLLLLKELQAELGFLLEAVHVEHGIRGAESENDAAFVVRLCEELEIPLHLHFVQAVDYAKEQKIGLEEAARILRYDAYLQTAANVSIGARVKVALAHHADDNAETVLFQMIRGSGIDGLGGMRPKRTLAEGVEVVRPLLRVTRSQIEVYLQEKGQSYCVDSTNEDVTYSRNKIRHEILPMLNSINAQAVAHMNRSAELLRELGDYLQEQMADVSRNVLRERADGLLILDEAFLTLPEILKKEVLHSAITKAAGSAKDIGLEHVELTAGLFELQVGRSLSLPYEVRAKRVYEGVLLKKGVSSEAVPETAFFLELSEEELFSQLQQGEVSVRVPDGVMKFSLSKISGENAEISKNTYTKCFDYDKIKGSFQIRTRRSGDYLIVDESGHRKRLQDYFINEKVPAEKRDEILLLTQADKVLWVIGGRISADTKVDGNTKEILKVQLTGGNYYDN